MARYIIPLFAFIFLMDGMSVAQTQAQIDSITAEFYKVLKNGQICRLLTDFGLINWWKK